MDESATDEYEYRVYRRMEMLLEENGSSPVGARSRRGNRVENFIMRGANTAAAVSWDMLRAIPFAYQKKHDRFITPEEFSAISKTAEPLLIKLASMHIDRFSMLARMVRNRSDLARAMHVEFPVEFFDLTQDTNGAEQLVFNTDVLRVFERVTQGVFINDPRVSCPARDARVPSPEGGTQSIIGSVYDIYRDIAEKYFVPHMDRYTDLMLQKA